MVLRQGLAPGHVYSHGLQALLASASDVGGDGKAGDKRAAPSAHVAAQLAQGLRQMADAMDAPEGRARVAMVSDELARAFMQDRLPPVPEWLPDPGPPPTLRSTVCCRAKVRESQARPGSRCRGSQRVMVPVVCGVLFVTAPAQLGQRGPAQT